MATQFADNRQAVDALVKVLRDDLLKEDVLPVPDIGKLAESMLRVVPRRQSSNIADKAGPFFDTAGLVAWLGVSRQALDNRVRHRGLLACLSSDNVRLYPTWQFLHDGTTVPGLRDVLRALNTGTRDSWTWALWMAGENPDLDGRTARDWLVDGGDPEPVIASAQRTAGQWAA